MSLFKVLQQIDYIADLSVQLATTNPTISRTSPTHEPPSHTLTYNDLCGKVWPADQQG